MYIYIYIYIYILLKILSKIQKLWWRKWCWIILEVLKLALKILNNSGCSKKIFLFFLKNWKKKKGNVKNFCNLKQYIWKILNGKKVLHVHNSKLKTSIIQWFSSEVTEFDQKACLKLYVDDIRIEKIILNPIFFFSALLDIRHCPKLQSCAQYQGKRMM